MDRVGEDRLWPEAAGAVVDVDVVERVGEEAAHLVDLAGVLAHVRLPPGAGARGEGRRLAEHLGRARDGEPRRDRVAQAAVVGAVPGRDQLLGLAQRAVENRRRVDGLVVGDPIHHHLAEDRPYAVRLGGTECAVHRGLVDGAIGKERGRPGGRERPERRGREAGGVFGIVESALQREDVALEPGQQVEPRPEPGVRQLGQVRVQVDHARQHDQRPQVDHRHVRGPIGRVADPRDLPRGIDLDQAVRVIGAAARRERRQDPGPQREWRPVGELHRRAILAAPSLPRWRSCPTRSRTSRC